jgi:REase_AHJR-like protein
MDFEHELKRVADTYTRQGYQVTIRPDPEALPPFAKDFKVEILAKRAAEGILVAVKKDRDELAADSNLTRYAEIIGLQKGRRFDFAILEAESPSPKEIDGANDFSEEDIGKSFSESLEMVRAGFARPALITAWAGFEAAMRLRLRAAGEGAGWGSAPRTMLNELYSNGVINVEEFRELENLFRVRNQIAHGFVSSLASEGSSVQFLCEIGHRLIEESRTAELSI